jgi:hypothetical protein
MTAVSSVLPCCKRKASGVVPTVTTFAEKNRCIIGVACRHQALVLDGASQSIYSYDQGERLLPTTMIQPSSTHIGEKRFEGGCRLKTGNALNI